MCSGNNHFELVRKLKRMGDLSADLAGYREERIAFLEHFLYGYYKRIERGLQHTVNVVDHIEKFGADGVDEADLFMISRSDPMYSVSYKVEEADGTIMNFRQQRPPHFAQLAADASKVSPIYSQVATVQAGADQGGTGGPVTKLSMKSQLNKYHKVINAFDEKNQSWFKWPVNDSVAPGYSAVISKPMDLTTLQGLIKDGTVATEEDYVRHIALTVSNAKKYNRAGDAVYMAADALETFARTTIPIYSKIIK